MNNKNNIYIQTFENSPDRQRYSHHDTQPRRNSYQMAIHSTKPEQIEDLYPSNSSISSINDHINTTQSLYTIHNGCTYCLNEYIQRSISQPIVRCPDNDFLLENATFLLDSPVHALRPAHYKTPGTLSPTRISLVNNESFNENLDSSNLSIKSIYRIVLFRSLASLFVLASLFTIEVLQTSIHSIEYSFQSLLTLHLSSSIAACIYSIHASHIPVNRHHWKISNVLAYDRCSQILLIISTIFTSIWIMIQYFHFFSYFVLLSASISGISLILMMMKTFDHLLQLSTTITIEKKKKSFEKFLFIYNSICHLSLTIGGGCLLLMILYQQSKYKYILIGSKTCFLTPCTPLDKRLFDNHMIRIGRVSVRLSVFQKGRKAKYHILQENSVVPRECEEEVVRKSNFLPPSVSSDVLHDRN